MASFLVMESIDHNRIVASGASLVVPMAETTVNKGIQYLDQSLMAFAMVVVMPYLIYNNNL